MKKMETRHVKIDYGNALGSKKELLNSEINVTQANCRRWTMNIIAIMTLVVYAVAGILIYCD